VARRHLEDLHVHHEDVLLAVDRRVDVAWEPEVAHDHGSGHAGHAARRERGRQRRRRDDRLGRGHGGEHQIDPQKGHRGELLERQDVLAVVLLAPTLTILALFIAYPFVLGVWLAVSDKVVGRPGAFVGLENFRVNLNDTIFLRAFQNTFVYTFIATALKLALGMVAALLLNHHFRFKRIVRAGMLLPWIVPTVLSTLAWQWMFDATFSVFNWMLLNVGLISSRILWLGDGTLAMGCLIAVNVWRGMPFFAITLLAGLQTVNPDVHEAAEIDGANAWQRFWRVTLPLIKPTMPLFVLLSMISTFADFQLVYVLTGGGPANATHLFATYAYQIGVGAGLLGQGAAISLALFPVLLVVVILQLWYIRRTETI
jgi:multiple sugar transport system permease protein